LRSGEEKLEKLEKQAKEARMMAEQKSADYLESTFPHGEKRTRRAAINQEYASRIVSYLKGGQEKDKHFCHLVSKSKFELLDFPKAGLRDVLVVRVTKPKQVSLAMYASYLL